MAGRNLFTCFVCNNRFQPRFMRRIDGENNEAKRDIAILRRDMGGHPALEVNDQTRLCMNCNRSILEEIELLLNDETHMRLNVLTQTKSASCLICDQEVNVQRLCLKARVNIFITSNIYIPNNVRCCIIHLDEKGFLLQALHAGLRFINRPYVLKGQELQGFLNELRVSALSLSKYETEEDFDDEEFYAMTSLTKEQFRDLFSFCDAVPVERGHEYVTKKNLLLFLTKMRHGISDNALKVIFKYSTRQLVSYVVDKVRKSLLLRFVRENIGFRAITRDDYIRLHVTDFANILYNSEPNVPKAIGYVDGTYSNVEKSSNFRVLRQSYCFHKGRHLVKPVLVVAPDGYILDIQGPYFSDSFNNDAALLRDQFEKDVFEMRNWFQANDILIVDRGYRDAADLLENLDIRYYMPELLERGQSQLTTEQANRTRVVTKTRWVVEARNGHIKEIFKFLSQVIRIPQVPHIGDYYRIAGAILNRYHQPIQMDGCDAEAAVRMLAQSVEVNEVQTRVVAENLQRRRQAEWERIDQNQLIDFPRLTLDYLKELTVGVYQLSLAPSYIQDSLLRQNNIFEVDLHAQEPGFARFRLFSRFRNATTHTQFISYTPIEENQLQEENPILGYYCTCKTGARTLGTCAHIASILWYLGYARHEQNVRYPPIELLYEILDAADRPLPQDLNLQPEDNE